VKVPSGVEFGSLRVRIGVFLDLARSHLRDTKQGRASNLRIPLSRTVRGLDIERPKIITEGKQMPTLEKFLSDLMNHINC
jgi:hypothetical protein